MYKAESATSDLDRMEEVLSESSECNWAVLQQSRHIQSSFWNVSSCGESEKSEKLDLEHKLCLFAPNVRDFEFAPIQNNDVVQVSAVESYDTLWIRSIKYDEQYCELMSKININIDDPAIDIANDSVVLVKYCGDYSRGIVLDKDSVCIQLMDIGTVFNADIPDCYYGSADVMLTEKRLVTPVKLKLPQNLSAHEKSAVVDTLNKWKHNRFTVQSKNSITPNSIVDLTHIVSGMTLETVCTAVIEKRWYINEIGRKNMNECEDVELTIIEKENISKGFISCVLKSDLEAFATQMIKLKDFGQTLRHSAGAYVPDKLEICLVLYNDEDEEELWYRAQYQQPMVNGRAQVGLIDFGISVIVENSSIRKIDDRFVYDRLSFTGKIRCTHTSLDLLDLDFFQNFLDITVKLLKPVGDSFEFHLENDYFMSDDDYIV